MIFTKENTQRANKETPKKYIQVHCYTGAVSLVNIPNITHSTQIVNLWKGQFISRNIELFLYIHRTE